MSCSEVVKKYIGYMDILRRISCDDSIDLSTIDITHMNDVVNILSVNGETIVGNCIINDREFSFHLSPKYMYFDYNMHQLVNYITTFFYESLMLEFVDNQVSVEYKKGGLEIFEKTAKENILEPKIMIDKQFPVSSEFDFLTGATELYNVTCNSSAESDFVLRKNIYILVDFMIWFYQNSLYKSLDDDLFLYLIN